MAPEDEYNEEDGLDEHDQLLIEYLAAGLTDAAAGLEVGCSAKTVQRRRKNPVFARVLAARKSERVAQVAAMLGEAAIEAVATMRSSLTSPLGPERLRAAGMIINSLVRLRAAADTEEAIEELRTDIAELRSTLVGGGSAR